jgi:hypothetical protein
MVEYITLYTINLQNFENTYPYFLKIKICYDDMHKKLSEGLTFMHIRGVKFNII